MDEKDLKLQLAKLSSRIGAKRVCLALQEEGLSPRAAELLSLGDHKGGFRRKTVAAVQAVLMKKSKAS